MAKLTHKLTDIQIRNWISKGDPVAKSDGDGLTFTLSAAGTAAWVLRYRLGQGRRRELTIGNYPDVSLSTAQEKARIARAAIDEGRDPANEKQEQKQRFIAEWSVRDLVDDYRKKHLIRSSYAKDTIDGKNRDYDQVVLLRLGPKAVACVSPVDIVSMIESSNRTWSISRRILISTSKLFNHACGLKIISANPCTGIKLTSIKGPRPPIRK